MRAGVVLGVLLVGGCGNGVGAGGGGGEGEPIRSAMAIGGLGNGPGTFAYPRALDHDRSGLWVVDRSARIQKVNPKTGECLVWFMMPEWALGKPVGVTVGPGPDGEELLYVADTHYHRVMVYRPPSPGPGGCRSRAEAELVASFGGYGTGAGQFIYPTDIAVLTSADGARMERLYVSEYGGNDRVSVFDSGFRYLFSFGRFGMGEDGESAQFQRPQSVAVARGEDGEGEVYVVDSRNHRIGRFSLEGELRGWIGSARSAGRELGSFRYPYGISLVGDGTAMVVEYGNSRVQRVDLGSGRGLGAWGRPGRGPGELAAPWAITVMDGQAYVLDSGNNRVVGFPIPRRRG